MTARIKPIQLEECGQEAVEALDLITVRVHVLEQMFAAAAVAAGDVDLVPKEDPAGFWFGLARMTKEIRLLIWAAREALIEETDAMDAKLKPRAKANV